jgi:hypothetical protein
MTSHWITLDKSSGHLSLKAALIGFHQLKKKHTSFNIAKAILHLLDWANVMLKVHIHFYTISILS